MMIVDGRCGIPSPPRLIFPSPPTARLPVNPRPYPSTIVITSMQSEPPGLIINVDAFIARGCSPLNNSSICLPA